MSRTRTNCFLGEQEQRVISSLLRAFPEDFTPESEVASRDPLPVPKLVDIRDGIATYDEMQARKQPD